MQNENIIREDDNNRANNGLFCFLNDTINGNINADFYNLTSPHGYFDASGMCRKYDIGRGGSHIWIADKTTKRRIGIILYP